MNSILHILPKQDTITYILQKGGYLIMLTFLFSCAQVVPLSGGDKDIEPPQEIESEPKNGSINFIEDKIIISFNEFIQLQNLNAQLIISPLMEKQPEINVKGKKLVIKLKDSLQANTTYSFNFGEAIMDITENNPIPNYKYVFSTGDYLDSLTYSGNIVNALNLTPVERMYVFLYDEFEDSIPYKSLPRYVTLSDKEGKFSITNIAKGKYKVFAINDINNNYLFDLPNEEVAFFTHFLKITKDTSGVTLFAFEEENNQQYVVKSMNEAYSKFSIMLNSPTKNLSLNILNDSLTANDYLLDVNNQQDTINIWLTKKLNDKKLIIEITDKGSIIDTVGIVQMDVKKDRIKNLLLSTNVMGMFDLHKSLFIKTARPIAAFQKENIVLKEDSIELSFNIIQKDSISNTFIIDYPFKEKSTYQLIIPEGTFSDYFGVTNDSLIETFKTKSKEDYSKIKIKVIPNFKENYILILSKNNKEIKRDYAISTSSIDYDYLSPGKYELKLIIDQNNDEKWTTGNYLNKLQPEKVMYYQKEILLKANWDTEINWEIVD